MSRFLKLAAIGLLLLFLLFHAVLSENTAQISNNGVYSTGCGSIVKVKTANGRNIIGCFKKWDPGYLRIQVKDKDTTIQKGDIQIVWVRKRAISTGLNTGLVLGGLTGGVFTYTMAGIGFDYSNNEFGTTEKIIAFSAGAIFGGLIGGGFSAIVGGAFPKWEKVYVKDNPQRGKYDTLSTLSNSVFSRIGEFQMLLNFSKGYSGKNTEGGIIGFNFRLLNLTSENTAMGPEYGHFNPGKPVAWSERNQDERIKLYGWFFRWGYKMENINPYLITGIGFYDWSKVYRGFSFGAGVRRPLNGSGKYFIIEGRIHKIQRYHSNLEFFTIQGGLSWSW